MEQFESTALGAAMIGSLAAGFYHSIEDMGKILKITDTIHPDFKNKEIYNRGYEKYLAIYRTLSAIY
jgi:sugar (pentulose or hexulose) kinase